MKKIIVLFCLLCILVTTVMAQDVTTQTQLIRPDSKSVAVILDLPAKIISNQKMNEMIMNKVQTSFAKPDYYIMPMEKVRLAQTNYCEEHGIPTFVDEHTMTPTLTMYDLKTLGKTLQADYIYYMSFTAGDVQMAGGMFNSSSATVGNCSVKVLDMHTEKYVYQKTVTAEGKSTTWFTIGLFGNDYAPEKAYKHALEKCLKKIVIDPKTFGNA